MPVKSSWIFFLIPLLMNVTAWSKNKETTKGLLPEIRLDQNNESNNESKAIQSEMLITATEEKALTALQKIIKNKKGSPEEADLWYRMAELQMRRSKSGRFFDLYQDSAYLKNTTFPAAKSSSKESIRKAIEIYNKIEKDFPKYKEMDSVLFNNAFAHQQLNLKNVAIELYSKMLQKYPKSELTPDATLAVGELYYEQQKFALALSYFEKIDQFPEAKVYFYGLYKTAWANYNLKQTPQGIKKLVQLIQLTPSAEALKQNSAVNSSLLQKHKHNLRKEALRDLVVFVGDELATKDTYSFFKKICTDSELAQAMVDLSQLYISHSKFKDIPIFLNEYIEKNPMGSGVVRSHLFIAETAETIKNRNGVIEQLLIVEKLCSPSSDWQKNQDQENLKMSCEDKFKSLRQELASKWWDIWQKNKKHAEFSGWTQKILELSIRQEPTNQPDIKTHYAYAELLFQTNQFIESSQEYEKIFNLTKEEPLRHDSLYSALFSVEKFLDSNDKNKSASHLQKRNFLGETYLQNYPEGLYADQVQFKLALVDYENKKLSSALERLNKVGEKDLELSTKSQDLILDIYNIQKNYNQIIAITTDILKKEKNLQRKSSLQQIQQESELAIAQNLSDTGKKQQASKALIEFGKKYPDSKLASQAQWQAIGLLFSEGQLQSAADQCWAFAKKYQKENKDKAYEAANEAIKAYIKLSQLQTAAEILENLATNIEFDKNSKLEEKTKNLELAADFYWLEGKNEKAQTIYKKILAKAPSKTWGTLYDKILLTETNPQRLETLKNEIVQKNIEPLATQYLTEKAQILFKNKKNSAAFDLAHKIISRDSAADYRVDARLIQAQILEDEFKNQSLKAKPERLNLVLGLKTEKLDKALTAYLSTLKMSSLPDKQIESLSGIDRLYADYIWSLENIPFSSDYSKEDQIVVKKEFEKIITVFQLKKNENKSQWNKIFAIANQTGFNNIRPPENKEDSVSPPVAFLPPVSALQSQWPNSELRALYKKKNLQAIDNQLRNWLDQKDKIREAYYHLNLLAEDQSLINKSLWMSDQALSDKDLPLDLRSLTLYQKAKASYKQSSSTKDLKKISTLFNQWLQLESTLKNNSTEKALFTALNNYNQKDYKASSENFSTLTAEQIYNCDMSLAYSESLAQTGQISSSLSVLVEALKQQTNDVMLLQQARILEVFKKDLNLASKSYEKVLRLTNDETLKEWLKLKLDFLKQNLEKQKAVTK